MLDLPVWVWIATMGGIAAIIAFAVDVSVGWLDLQVVGWVLMLAWSKPWLHRFRFGPLEWLWRCLTYGRLLPLR